MAASQNSKMELTRKHLEFHNMGSNESRTLAPQQTVKKRKVSEKCAGKCEFLMHKNILANHIVAAQST